MDTARYYPGVFDVSLLAIQLAKHLEMRAYQTQWFGAGNQMTVQVRKGSEAAKFLGAQAALTVVITQHQADVLTGRAPGLLVTLGQQRWGDKALAAGVGAFFLWPLLIPAAVGAVRQTTLPGEVLSIVDTLVLQQNPMAYPTAVPTYVMPQVQVMYQPMPTPASMPVVTVPQQVCPTCGQMNNTGASFCQSCGSSLDGSVAVNRQPAAPAQAMAPTMPSAPTPDPVVAPPPAPTPPPAPAQPPKQTAAPTTRVGRTAAPTERVAAPSGPIVPAGPTGVMGLPSGRKVPIVGEEAVVGRGNPDGTDPVEVDMTTEIESSTVSRRHARITRAGAGFEIEDLNSANSTTLNNEPLSPGRKYALHKGDVIEFGKVKCVFSIQDK
jgi:hypothetical protein